ncbi:MAG: endo-1,3-alpha-glucanase family glycosylhydrolase [Spirochaetota bacterium]
MRHDTLFALGVLSIFSFGGFSQERAGRESTPTVSGSKTIAAHYMTSMVATFHPKGKPSRQNDYLARPLAEQVEISRDFRAAARWDIEQACIAGVNTFAVWMYPRMGEINSNDTAFQNMLFGEMQKEKTVQFYPDFWWFKMDPENWGKIMTAWGAEPRPTIEAEMRRYGQVLKTWSERFGDVWRKHDGKWIIAMQDHALFKNVPYAKAAQWLFAPLGGREKVYLKLCRYPSLPRFPNGGEIAPDWLAAADAVFDWSANSSYGDALEMRKQGEALCAASQKEWCPSFAPSFMQSRGGDGTAPTSPKIYERLGIVSFQDEWMEAIRSGAKSVAIITWNDMSEDTSLMPEENHGYAYLRLNRYFARWFQSGKRPDIEREEILLFHHPQVVEGLELPGSRKPTESGPGCSTPPTDFVAVVTFLKKSAEVSVIFHKQVIAKKECPPGYLAWFLYNPRKQLPPESGLADTDPVYPSASDDLAVTILDKPFTDAEVFLEVKRGSEPPILFRSQRPIVSAAGRADLTTIGNVFRIER